MIDIAHIHPMLVHFPIVLFILTVALEFLIMIRGGDLAGRDCLPRVALSALLLGTISAIAAASFGDMALDKAVALGFPKAPLETHETLGLTTMWIFIVLSLVQLWAWWRRLSLANGRGWALAVFGLAGVGVLLIAAYHGGELVYGLGVNVAPVKP